MRFGKCSDCFDYKYLEDGICPTCSDTEDWAVIRISPPIGYTVYRTGIREEEAKDMAENQRFLKAAPAWKYSN